MDFDPLTEILPNGNLILLTFIATKSKNMILLDRKHYNLLVRRANRLSLYLLENVDFLGQY